MMPNARRPENAPDKEAAEKKALILLVKINYQKKMLKVISTSNANGVAGKRRRDKVLVLERPRLRKKIASVPME